MKLAHGLRHAILFSLAGVAAAPAAEAANLTCSSATTLDALVTCIRSQMPGNGSNGFVAPTAAQQTDWRTVVGQMLGGSCNFALPASLGSILQIRTFSDSQNGKDYCLLMEVLDANGNGIVDRGWGTFIVDPNATREISHQAAHPIYDIGTENQAVGVFKGTDSRSYLMCGAHRLANSASSSCQSSYGSADCAHNVANMFHSTNQELLSFYGAGAWQAIQWHGMAVDTCDGVDAYLSLGRSVSPQPGDKNLELVNNMFGYHPTWQLECPGGGDCSLNATDNTQGRLLNGVPAGSVCGTAASSHTGRFLSIEQDPGFRNASDWIAAVQDTWPTNSPDPPDAPTGLTATSGNQQASLVWNAASGASSYSAHRSIVSGGPYTTVATGLSGTSHIDAGLTNGTTYHYVVTALNANGESPNSNQASVTPQAPQPPPAPAGLSATPGKKKVTLAWTAAPGATSYRVKRGTTSGGPYTLIASPTGTSYTNTGLQTGTTYYYVVSAVNAAGEGASSSQASAIPR